MALEGVRWGDLKPKTISCRLKSKLFDVFKAFSRNIPNNECMNEIQSIFAFLKTSIHEDVVIVKRLLYEVDEFW